MAIKTFSRAAFVAWGNAFWLAQSVAEVLAPQLRSYLAWRGLAFKPDLQIGCFRDSYFDSLSDRLYVVGLLWLLSAPLMTAIAWKQPERWPGTIRHVAWRGDAAGLSWASLLAVLALAAWPLIAAAARAGDQHHAHGTGPDRAYRRSRALLPRDPAQRRPVIATIYMSRGEG